MMRSLLPVASNVARVRQSQSCGRHPGGAPASSSTFDGYDLQKRPAPARSPYPPSARWRPILVLPAALVGLTDTTSNVGFATSAGLDCAPSIGAIRTAVARSAAVILMLW